MKRTKLISAIAALAMSASFTVTALADYSSAENGTLTWTFKNSAEKIDLSGDGYNGIKGSGTVDSNEKNGLEAKIDGNYIEYTPSVSGEVTLLAKHGKKAELYIDTKLKDKQNKIYYNDTGSTVDNISSKAELAANTTYYIYNGGGTSYIYSMTFTPKAVDTSWKLSKMYTAITVPSKSTYNYSGLILGNQGTEDIVINSGNSGKNGYEITQNNGGYIQYTPLADGTLTFTLKNAETAEPHFGTAYDKTVDPKVTADGNGEMTVTENVSAGNTYYLYNGAKTSKLYILNVEYKVSVQEPVKPEIQAKVSDAIVAEGANDTAATGFTAEITSDDNAASFKKVIWNVTSPANSNEAGKPGSAKIESTETTYTLNGGAVSLGLIINGLKDTAATATVEVQ